MTGHATRASGSHLSLARFNQFTPEPARSLGLRADHPALAEARTIFPSTVLTAGNSPRLLVSGQNNPKLGRVVTKGPRRGWPIYQLTLEERATCPRSCAQWASCYGNTMPFARRHRPDADFLDMLGEELIDLALAHPRGFMVRLHTLGDFYSLDYVAFWERALDAIPALHAFGYTARTDEIGEALRGLALTRWDRFSIRNSTAVGGARTAVVLDAPRAGTIMCPAQAEATTACATCGLCWSLPDAEIGFLRHGMKSNAGLKRAA